MAGGVAELFARAVESALGGKVAVGAAALTSATGGETGTVDAGAGLRWQLATSATAKNLTEWRSRAMTTVFVGEADGAEVGMRIRASHTGTCFCSAESQTHVTDRSLMSRHPGAQKVTFVT
ncbi:MAG: hypothetical protein ABI969_11690 [bacterium]